MAFVTPVPPAWDGRLSAAGRRPIHMAPLPARQPMFSLPPLPPRTTGLDAASVRLNAAAQRLSGLRRLNGAADDAAGLAISERLWAQLRGEQVAAQGALDGSSLAETADAALGQIDDRLQRMRELALQSRNGALADSDRRQLDAEYRQLGEEVNRVIGATRFNGRHVLADDAGVHPIGTGAGARDTLALATPDLRADAGLGAATDGSVATAAGGAGAIEAIDRALASLAGHRAVLGASQRRLEAAGDTAALRAATLSVAHDRLTGADPAAEASAWRLAGLQHEAALWAYHRAADAAPTRRLLTLFG